MNRFSRRIARLALTLVLCLVAGFCTTAAASDVSLQNGGYPDWIVEEPHNPVWFAPGKPRQLLLHVPPEYWTTARGQLFSFAMAEPSGHGAEAHWVETLQGRLPDSCTGVATVTCRWDNIRLDDAALRKGFDWRVENTDGANGPDPAKSFRFWAKGSFETAAGTTTFQSIYDFVNSKDNAPEPAPDPMYPPVVKSVSDAPPGGTSELVFKPTVPEDDESIALNVTAPVNTVITTIDARGCTIATDGKIATCPSRKWRDLVHVQLRVDVAAKPATTLNGGTISFVKKSVDYGSADFSVKVALAQYPPAVNSVTDSLPGETSEVVFTPKFPPGDTRISLEMSAPESTSFLTVDTADCTIATDGKTAKCIPGQWVNPRHVMLRVASTAKPGTTLQGGLINFQKDGKDYGVASFAVKVISLPPTIDKNDGGYRGGTAEVLYRPRLGSGVASALRINAPVGTTLANIDTDACTIAADGKSATCKRQQWGQQRRLTLNVDPANAVGSNLVGGLIAFTDDSVDHGSVKYAISVVARPLTASVKSVSGKTAVVEGAGEREASITLSGDWGSAKVRVSANDTWIATVPNLKKGDNAIRVVQHIDGANDQSVQLSTHVDGVPVSISSPTNGARVVAAPLVVGSAEPGETVVVKDLDSDTILFKAAVDAAGNWAGVSKIKLTAGHHELVAADSSGSKAQVGVNVVSPPAAHASVTAHLKRVRAL